MYNINYFCYSYLKIIIFCIFPSCLILVLLKYYSLIKFLLSLCLIYYCNMYICTANTYSIKNIIFIYSMYNINIDCSSLYIGYFIKNIRK